MGPVLHRHRRGGPGAGARPNGLRRGRESDGEGRAVEAIGWATEFVVGQVEGVADSKALTDAVRTAILARMDDEADEAATIVAYALQSLSANHLSRSMLVQEEGNIQVCDCSAATSTISTPSRTRRPWRSSRR